MRKILAILSVFLYLFTSTGVYANIHYCHSSIIDVGFFEEAESCCKKDTKPCCKDESLLIKYENISQRTSSFTPNNFISYIELTNCVVVFDEPVLDSNDFFIDFESPPPKNLTSLYCNYIFYG